MELVLESPYYLLLLLPAGFLIYLFWTKAKNIDLKNRKLISSLRSFLFICLIFALCNPLIVWTFEKESVVFVVDQSFSMGDETDEINQFISDAIHTKDEEDPFAVVTVGGEAAVENAMTNLGTFSGFTAKVPQENTNLEKGLRLASSLFQEQQNGRIVLVTDGLETDGNALEEASLLRKKGYEIDVVPFVSQRDQDMGLVELNVPELTFQGEQANAAFRIDSSVEGQARVRILVNNEVILDDTLDVQTGINEYTFAYLVESEGYKQFEAQIFYENDQVAKNNRLTAVSYTEGPPKVLLVEGKEGEGTNLKKALSAAHVPVDVLQAGHLPSTLTSLLEYETIIFSNVSATDVSQQKMELIEHAVKDYGKGFMMTGGDQSFGLGGYFDTPIEKLLPVDMDIKGKKEIPSLGLMIVLDRSGSMQGYKLELAKEAAARTVSLLREEDTLGVIAFDDQPWEIVKAGPIKDKEAVEEKIRTISGGGGTSIYPALEEAYQQIMESDAKRKHIILLTDGQSATTNDYYRLIEDGLDQNITLSTVAIGDGADRFLLESLAEAGSGRFYDVVDPSVIPTILSRETVMTTRTYIEDDPFYPTVTSLAIDGLHEVFENGLPQMNAYIAVTPKSKAQTILTSEKDDPVLAVWQYGIGRSVAFTSDLTGEWSGDWPNWEEWQEYWLDLVNWTFSPFESDAFQMDVAREGEKVTVHLTTDEAIINPLEANVTANDGEAVEARMTPIRPGEYEVTFNGKEGIYFLQVNKQTAEGNEPIIQTGFSVRYSDEYLIQESNAGFFENLVSVTGGKKLESAEDVFRPLEKKISEERSIQSVLLVMAFFLLLGEVSIRRFGITIPKLPLKLGKVRVRETVQMQKKSKPAAESAGSGEGIAGESPEPVSINKPGKKTKTVIKKDAEERSSQMDRLLSAKNRRK
ncbi:VWA domain-containing protein [Bacillus litorisediminis]|uniref:VWA domain-containing protein n=1 Tax=Bacillus litorisediminis TaxID=2922713 RepID=UPI001FAFC463|nr:VWA domain-containing protein [Bacillus litorisediminis]